MRQPPKKLKRRTSRAQLHGEASMPVPRSLWLELPADLYNKVEKFRQKGRYDDINEFILILIAAQLEELRRYGVFWEKEEQRGK